MDDVLARRVARVIKRAPIEAVRVERGEASKQRWVVRFADGTSAFAKQGTSEQSGDSVRREHQLYSQLPSELLPKAFGLDDDPELPLLLVEDLSAAHWPPPWRARDVEQLLEALKQLSKLQPLPRGLPDLEQDRARYAGWLQVERAPKPLLGLGVCSREWLEAALPVLLMAQDLAILSGGDLVHGDLQRENVGLFPDRVVFVGWSSARRGNAAFDLVCAALDVRLGGGPMPEELAPEEGPLATLLCGYFAANAGLPPRADGAEARQRQLRLLHIALPWVARALGLPPPDGKTV